MSINSTTEAFALPNRDINKEMLSLLLPTARTRISPNNYNNSESTTSTQLHKSKNNNKKSNLLIISAINAGGDSSTLSKENDEATSWNEKLTKIANIASILCAIDCTVLPLFNVALSFLGVFKTSSVVNQELIHAIGHYFANYFVLPVAGTVSIMHFVTNKRLPSLLTAVGMSFVYVTNSHGGPILKLLPHDLLHILHHNPVWHRVVNLTGVACMLGANYLSKRMGCSAHTVSGDECCDHKH